jgi:hypothetical protein
MAIYIVYTKWAIVQMIVLRARLSSFLEEKNFFLVLPIHSQQLSYYVHVLSLVGG